MHNFNFKVILFIIILIGLTYGLITALDQMFDLIIFRITGWNQKLLSSWIYVSIIYFVLILVMMYIVELDIYGMFSLCDEIKKSVNGLVN